jgi:Transposase IS116/IS110/IS902 family
VYQSDSATQDLRSLLRTRKQLVRERNSHVQRLQKTLEDANIKLDSVVSDIIGMTGRAILEAIIGGESDPVKLAALAHPRIKSPPEKLREAVRGRIMPHHRFLLQLHLQQIDALNVAVAAIDWEVDTHIEPFRIAVELLLTIPGIGDVSARTIAAEVGTDMSRFPTASHFISWAGLCPKNDESAGKRRSTTLRKGAPEVLAMKAQNSWEQRGLFVDKISVNRLTSSPSESRDLLPNLLTLCEIDAPNFLSLIQQELHRCAGQVRASRDIKTPYHKRLTTTTLPPCGMLACASRSGSRMAERSRLSPMQGT